MGESQGRGSQDRPGHCMEFPAGMSLSRCGDSQGVGRGRRGLAEMKKHPEAAKPAAGGASLAERGDPKVRARGWGRVGRVHKRQLWTIWGGQSHHPAIVRALGFPDSVSSS